MPELSLSPTERARIGAIANELDATIQNFFADARESLSEKQWDLLMAYAAACVSRFLEVGSLLHAVVDAQRSRAVGYPGRGREVFVREALAAWRDAFAPIPQIWMLAPILTLVPGGEERVLADISTLEAMAENRMFSSLDEQCATLVADLNSSD